jgi:hypothetical protein
MVTASISVGIFRRSDFRVRSGKAAECANQMIVEA